jgi:hypothetical protein
MEKMAIYMAQQGGSCHIFVDQKIIKNFQKFWINYSSN